MLNFDMIHAQARGESLDKNGKDSHKTVRGQDIQGYTDKDSIVSSVTQSRRKDLHLERRPIA